MLDHPLYGLSLPEHGWVPSPSYVLRRDRALVRISELEGGRALEIGCGAGALLHDLVKMGFACEAIETSPRALEITSEVFAGRSDVRVFDAPQSDWKSKFDLVIAFEVLEHIEDDFDALETWASWLAPGGHLLLSVPAHRRRWNPTDEWAGHFRRYESGELRSLVENAGLDVVEIESYGFPLANALEAIRARTWQRIDKKNAARARQTAQSGVERRVESRFFRLQTSRVGTLAMRGFCRLQRVFAHTELGNGFFLLAKKAS